MLPQPTAANDGDSPKSMSPSRGSIPKQDRQVSLGRSAEWVIETRYSAPPDVHRAQLPRKMRLLMVISGGKIPRALESYKELTVLTAPQSLSNYEGSGTV